MMHRLVEFCGKYKVPIRLSYLPGFFKGLVMKSPLMAAFFMACDFIAGRMTKEKCLIYGLIILACVVLQAVLQNITDRLQSATGFKVFADKRMEMGDHFRKLSMGYFTEGNIGKVSSVLSTDMNFIEENAMGVLEELVGLMISQGLMLAFMFFLNWRLGLISLFCLLLIVFLGNMTTRKSISHSIKRQESSEKLTGSVLEFAEGIGIIKTFNLLGKKSKEITNAFEENCDTSIGFEMAYAPWCASIIIAYALATVAVLFASGILASNGMMTNEYFLGMILFVCDLFGPIKVYYGNVARLTVTDACLDRIESVFEATEISNDGNELIAERKDADEKIPEISYENVSFAYGEKEALKNVSFDVKRGQMIALVGPSGGGKSTIANLLARFWDVKSGCIKIRGTDVRNVPVANLMDNISMVFQRVYLFQDSVFNNIAMGKTNATREEVIEVAKKARCYDFIMNLPNGFDTVIGEGGADLSGGEQQRISIARCMLKDAPVVILDEATASVDADNEHFIQEAISELCRGKTLIVIAHRLNTIRNANKILVIKNGKVAESGTHEELMTLKGQYWDMVERQIC